MNKIYLLLLILLFVSCNGLDKRELPKQENSDAIINIINNRKDVQRVPFGIKPGGISYWSNSWIFKDIFKQSMKWRSTLKNTKLKLDKRGWVSELQSGEKAFSLIFRDIKGEYPEGKYICLYDGTGKLSFDGDAKIISSEPGRIELEVSPSNKGIKVVLEKTDPENHLRNISIVKQEFEKNYKEHPFYPEFITLLQNFQLIHFAGLMKTTKLKSENWSSRTQINSQTQTDDNGIAIEYAVQLCNTLKKDGWFCIPHWADDDYVRKFAKLVKKNLAPELNVYIEYSYDIGFWITKPAEYCREKGLEYGLSRTKNPTEAGDRYYISRSIEVFQIWKDVFEYDERLTCVLAHGDFKWKGAWRYADAFASINIFGGKLGTPKNAVKTAKLTIDELLEKIHSIVKTPVTDENKKQINEIKKYGMRPISFYVTQALFADPRIKDKELFLKIEKQMLEVNKHPKMKQIYLDHIEKWQKAGIELMVHPKLVRKTSKWGSWGLLENMTQKNSPKWAALQSVVKKSVIKKQSSTSLIKNYKAEDDLDEKTKDPVMGRVTSHLGAAITINGYNEGENKVKFAQKYTLPPKSVFWAPLYLKGKEKRQYFRFFGMRTPENRWQKYTLKFIPESDGRIAINLGATSSLRYKGASYNSDGKWQISAHYDNFSAKGADFENGSFEKFIEGKLENWKISQNWGGIPAKIISDLQTSQDGRKYVRVETGGNVIQYLENIKQGQEVELTFHARQESIEKQFNIRIDFNGIVGNSSIKITKPEIPMKAVLYKIDPTNWGWKIPERHKASPYRKALLSKVYDQWTPQSVSFIPDSDGEMEVTFHATRIIDAETGNFIPRFVCYDNITADGADLEIDGDFEDSILKGFSRIGKDINTPILHMANSNALIPNKFVRLWYQNGLRFKLKNLKKGKRVALKYIAKKGCYEKTYFN